MLEELNLLISNENGRRMPQLQYVDNPCSTAVMKFYNHFFFVSIIFFLFYSILLYNTVLVLPYINMYPPWVYVSSQS